MKWLLGTLLLCLASAASAQSLPTPDPDNPRLQTFSWMPGQAIRLRALPQTALTVMLEPGETISEVTLDRRGAFDVHISAEQDSFLLVPKSPDATANLEVTTDRRSYRFLAETGEGLMAAYLVRYQAEQPYRLQGTRQGSMELPALSGGDLWHYRLRGDQSVRPADISDDGIKTHIRFAPDQSLPAIFAIGPTGDEQIVNGHMRDDVFVIDRVWQELVFRIDKDKATAKRNPSPEAQGG
ncbi:MAG: TrbG/VirB9 family P-type conjugative transfer protein [Sphingomonadaceae bacterium]|nr:TrbG/VirB9 family P-type conjugative transfer protein [Sphingomonadaceae bacterium]